MSSSWFTQFQTTKGYSVLQQKPLVYFCIEYALSDELPTYAGGLGILAGDYVRELADQHIPSVAIGLFYQSKYGSFDTAAGIGEKASTPPAEEHGLTIVLGGEKKPLLIKIPIQDHDVYAQVWMWKKGTIPVYLLDTNVPENTQADRLIGFKLYDANKEIRLKQEMVLGIGGFRLLEALHIQPSLYHINEGHSALLYLEIIRHEMQKRKVGFHDALQFSSHHLIFTNHTLIAAGHEIYNNELFTLLIGKYASELEIPVADIAALGNVHDSQNFSLSLFAIRLAGKINAVSKLHAKEAIKSWTDYHIEAVTNGIHIATWDTVPAGGDVVTSHKEQKKKLLGLIKDETGQVWEENTLLLGWARRMVRYKRPLALFDDLQAFLTMARDAKRPVRVVMAGIAHQEDAEGKEIIQKLRDLIEKELSGTVVYLQNYKSGIAKMLTSGCDIWLNTPVIGSEACGTSGMKAALNGTLALSTKDGWVDEIDISGKGWLVDSDAINQSLLNTLRDEVIPAYYAEDKTAWESSMGNARKFIQEQFSTTRMLQDYFEKVYLPILTTSYSHYFEAV